SGSESPLAGAHMVGINVFDQAATGDVAGALTVHVIGNNGSEFVRCDLILGAVPTGTFGLEKDCLFQGHIIMWPLPGTCQHVLRFLPDNGHEGGKAVTIGLARARGNTCPDADREPPPEFTSVEVHSVMTVNGNRLEYLQGTDEYGGFLARLDLTAPDGSSLVIDANTIWQEGGAGQSMQFLSPADVVDVTGE